MASYIGPPPGTLFHYAGSSAPTGYLLCDGSAVSRTTYADLFAAIGTAYGVGNGTTTFNVPDGQGRMLVGLGTHADVATLGNNDGSALSSRRPKHKHTRTPTVAMIPGNALQGDAGNANVSTGNVTVGPQTGFEPTDTPAYVVTNTIIKF